MKSIVLFGVLVLFALPATPALAVPRMRDWRYLNMCAVVQVAMPAAVPAQRMRIRCASVPAGPLTIPAR